MSGVLLHFLGNDYLYDKVKAAGNSGPSINAESRNVDLSTSIEIAGGMEFGNEDAANKALHDEPIFYRHENKFIVLRGLFGVQKAIENNLPIIKGKLISKPALKTARYIPPHVQTVDVHVGPKSGSQSEGGDHAKKSDRSKKDFNNAAAAPRGERTERKPFNPAFEGLRDKVEEARSQITIPTEFRGKMERIFYEELQKRFPDLKVSHSDQVKVQLESMELFQKWLAERPPRDNNREQRPRNGSPTGTSRPRGSFQRRERDTQAVS